MRESQLVIAGVVLGILLAVAVLMFTALIVRRAQKRKKAVRFQHRWHEIQKLCAKGDTWPMAVIRADTLLDDVLKSGGFRGRTAGERLVSAQRSLSNNDSAWFGHKLRNKLVHEEIARLYKRDVQAALKGFRQALIDLGVLS